MRRKKKKTIKNIGVKTNIYEGLDAIWANCLSLQEYLDKESPEFLKYLFDVETNIFHSQYVFISELYGILLAYIQWKAIPIDPYEFFSKDVRKISKVYQTAKRISSILHLNINKQKYITNVFHRLCSELKLDGISDLILSGFELHGSILSSLLKWLYFRKIIRFKTANLYLYDKTKMVFQPKKIKKEEKIDASLDKNNGG